MLFIFFELLFINAISIQSASSSCLNDSLKQVFLQPKSGVIEDDSLLEDAPLTKSFEKMDQAHLSQKNKQWANWQLISDFWGPSTDPADESILSSLRSRRIAIMGNPEKDHVLQVVVSKNEAVEKMISIPWDPRSYSISKNIRSRPMNHGFLATKENISSLSGPLHKYVSHLQEISTDLDSRFASLLVSKEIKPNAENLNIYLRYKESQDAILGMRPADRLSDYTWGFMKLPESLLIKNTPGVEGIRYNLRGDIRTTWIATNKNVQNSDALDLATNHMLRQLSAKRTDLYSSSPYALSVNLQGKSVVNINYLNLGEYNKALKFPQTRSGTVSEDWKKVHEKLQSYISQAYQKNLSLSPEITEKLNQFTSANQDRMSYFFFSDRPLENAGKDFKIQGSIGVIKSDQTKDLLSLESYAGVQLDRADGEKVAELTRFGVDEELRPFGPKMMWQLSSDLIEREGLSRVFAVTNEPYAKELINRFHFKKISEHVNTANQVEYVLQITPDDFITESLIH